MYTAYMPRMGNVLGIFHMYKVYTPYNPSTMYHWLYMLECTHQVFVCEVQALYTECIPHIKVVNCLDRKQFD